MQLLMQRRFVSFGLIVALVDLFGWELFVSHCVFARGFSGGI